MPQQKISKDVIVRGATALIEEEGYTNFTLHELAFRLGVKPSSLYNHMRSMEDLKAAISKCAIEKMKVSVQNAKEGKNGKESIIATAIALRTFAHKNRELYKTVFSFENPEGSMELADLIDADSAFFTLTHDESVHFARAFCSSVFGFIMLENAGYFPHTAATDTSFIAMIALLISSLPTP